MVKLKIACQRCGWIGSAEYRGPCPKCEYWYAKYVEMDRPETTKENKP